MKDLIEKIGFSPKENTKGIFIKKYSHFDNYAIEVDFENKKFNYGNKIVSESATTQNFSQDENWVVLECVDRLITKGYSPENIILEKIYPSGHGTSGRLDILVKKDGKAYLMIECKTWGKEFEKEFNNFNKNGGQLFTYFQQDTHAEYLVLYASRFDNQKLEYRNEIVKIEEDYRQAGNVKDLYERWNKLTKTNGLFDDWVHTYEFQSKALTREELEIIKQEDSSFIFNRFLEILRQNVVSDKPNAFNKIFTLFLCKIVDEDRPKTEQLHFQWLEGEDDNISFQKRLTDLYKRGMEELLEKEITDLSDKEFNQKFGTVEESQKKEFLRILTEIRLKKNNEFAFKEVFDDESFEENAKVVKDVVELLQKYQLRYNKKHQYLGDFFELLLTTGLKQESGQFFTPVPVAKYIIKSLPINKITSKKLTSGNPNDLLPSMIDYAAGSGHFLTESMEEVQNIIENVDENTLNPQSAKKIKSWKQDQFDWAFDYVYGIEKDYRLVKTAKVSCYLHGDGLAKVIHADGLGTFDKTSAYRSKLKEKDHDFTQDNKQFDIVISNPPYSVSAFKGSLVEENAKKDFELFDRLTDQSSEIECLFVERTKQLLKDGGVAGIILPSSILSNTGIYTKTREIILKYFEIIGITELGSGTFMATGTNTVVLFLRRRNNYEWQNIASSVDKFFVNFQDITVSGIENVFSKYIRYVWGNLDFTNYISLCEKTPNEAIQKHEIFVEYSKKLKVKNKEDLLRQIIEREKEKLLYFILAYKQKVVLTKTGEKQEEKQFLGYEFSNRRGYEGIHAIQRSKSIDECTSLFDPKTQENPAKASFYTYKNFIGEDFEIDEGMVKNVSIIDLVDMMTFDRVDFEKTVNLNASKKVKIESKYNSDILENLVDFQSGLWKGEKGEMTLIKVLRNTNFKLNNGKLSYDDIAEIEVENSQLESRLLKFGDIILEKSGGSDTQAIGRVVIFDKKDNEKYSYSNFCSRLRVKNNNKLDSIFLWLLLNDFYRKGGTIPLQNGVRLLNIDLNGYKKIKIPLPPKDIQEKIVKEIEGIEKKEKENKERVDELKEQIISIIPNFSELEKLENISLMLKRGKSPKYGDSKVQIIKSGQARGYKEFDFSEKHFVSQDFSLDERKLEKGDILINSSGVGTAGRVTLFDLEGDFVVDSHVTIMRLNKEKALPSYILYSLAKIGFKTIEKMALGQSGQIELSSETIKNIRISLPSLPEQQKIVAQIEKIEQEIETLQTEIDNAKKQKERVLRKYL